MYLKQTVTRIHQEKINIITTNNYCSLKQLENMYVNWKYTGQTLEVNEV